MGFQIGDNVGDYRIVSAIGQGGAGRVFRVEHRITGRVEAMKTLLQGRAVSAEPAERFQREIKLQASLDHPNIASVHNAFWSGEDLVMIMELVPGESLDQLIERGPLPPGRTLRYAVQCLIALEYAHGRGITHRDIKPENIMVTPDGVIKLMDFGLAKDMSDPKLTQTGAVVGSLYYLSPEQAQGLDQTDHRTDIYSFGAVLYEMATGRRPFDYPNSFRLLQAAVNERPAPPSQVEPSVLEPLSEAILRAMEKAPEERFPSAKEFRRTLEGIARNPAAAGAALSPVRTSARRKPAEPPRVERERRKQLAVRGLLVALSFIGLSYLGLRALTDNPLAKEVKSYQEAAAAPDALPAAPEAEAAGSYRPTLSATLAEPARSLAFSPSGDMALAGDAAGRVALFDLKNGRRLGTLQHSAEILAVAFGSRGARAAAGASDDAVLLWTIRKPGEARRLAHAGPVTAVAFSPDGGWLASGSADRSVRLWNLETPGESLGFAGPEAGPTALAFSPAGPLLAATSAESRVRLWGFGAERTREELEGLGSSGGRALLFSPNGLELGAAGAGRVVVWDLPTRERKLTLDAPSDLTALTCTAGGRWLALARPRRASNVVELWDVAAQERVARVEHGAEVVALTLSANGERLGAATADGRVTVWATGR